MVKTFRIVVRRREGLLTLCPIGAVDGSAAAEIGRCLEGLGQHTYGSPSTQVTAP